MGANFESFFSYFNIDVETKTSGPTLKLKTEPFILSKFQNMQPNILPQESNLLTKKTDSAGTPQQNAIYVS